MKLTANETECLVELRRVARSPELYGEAVAPIDLGGQDGSHHSGTLKRLAIKGLVLRRKRGASEWEDPERLKAGIRYRYRGSCVYRISDAGLAALEAQE